jgi:hypothetical protein
METATATIQTTRKNLDINTEVLRCAKIAAADAGISVKRYLENLLELHVPKIEIRKKHVNPSPSGDPWFDDPENIKMIEEAEQELREGKGIKMTLEDIDRLLGYGV